MFIYSFILTWIICTVLSATILLGYFHSYRSILVASDRFLAWGLSLIFGPIALIAALIVSGFGTKGLRF